jgi:Txe/YoeB family toxin of Txe-Axe toxin-antitoxin module
MPEKVVEKANKVRSSINEAINKLDKVMFKSTPAQKKFKSKLQQDGSQDLYRRLKIIYSLSP